MMYKINASDIKNMISEGCDANHAIVAQVSVMKSLVGVAVRSGGRQSDHGNIH
jgi:hypothetical protein